MRLMIALLLTTSAAMAEVPRQGTALRPAPVAIHDDGNVAWQSGRAR